MGADPFVDTLREWIELSMKHSMRSFIRFARKSGLSMSHLGATFYIHHQGSSCVSELGEHLGVTSAAASQMLERLVQQELILRTEDPVDRRAKQIVLTEKGQRLLEESVRARQEWLGDLSETLSDSEKETTQAALHILIDRVKNLAQPVES